MRIIRLLVCLPVVIGILAIAGCGGGGAGTPPATVTGNVYLIDGSGAKVVPVPAATVSAGGGTVTTDANGAFTLMGISSTATQITIKATGYKDLVQALPVLKPSTTLNVTNNLGDIFLSGTGYTASVSGTVVRADTQAVVPGAVLRLNGLFATTSASGAFTISGLPVGLGGSLTPVGLITASGYQDKPLVIDLPLGDSTPPNAVNILGIIPIAPPVGTIPGSPFDISGIVTVQGAVDNSTVSVTLLNQGGATVSSMTTAADGAYSFWAIAGNYTLTFQRVGYTPKQSPVTVTRPDTPVSVNITLVP